MINNEILSFIKEQTSRGTTKDEIKNLLITEGGWDEKDVEEAFDTVNFSARSYPSVVKSAAMDGGKGAGNNPSFTAPVSSQQVSVSGAPSPAASQSIVRPSSFAPGLSHVEQPKIMEPSSPDPFHINTSPILDTPSPEMVLAPKGLGPAVTTSQPMNGALSRLRERIASGIVAPSSDTTQSSPKNNPLDQFKVSPISRGPSDTGSPILPVSKKEAENPATPVGVSLGAQPKIDPIVKNPTSPQALSATETGGKTSPSIASFQGISRNFGASSIPSGIAPVSSPASQSLPLAGSRPLVFPKNDMGVSQIVPTAAQLATLEARKKQGGRFLVGSMMFFVGLLLGGISMNAYMNGYFNKAVFGTVAEKVMNLIGLDTPVPFPASKVSVPADTGS